MIWTLKSFISETLTCLFISVSPSSPHWGSSRYYMPVRMSTNPKVNQHSTVTPRHAYLDENPFLSSFNLNSNIAAKNNSGISHSLIPTIVGTTTKKARLWHIFPVTLHSVSFIRNVPFIQWTFSWHCDMKSSEHNTIHVNFLKCNKLLWPSIYSSYCRLFLLKLGILQSITSELLLFSLVWLLWWYVGVILINELHTYTHTETERQRERERERNCFYRDWHRTEF